jgi:hypothetical protein
MELNEISPCDSCEWAQRCSQYELACRAFSAFILHGTFKENTPRIPTGQLFNKIFNEDDKALRNYLKSIKMKEEMAKNEHSNRDN